MAGPIEAELGKNEAWVGEGVPLFIILKAQGPFSGTASFDLPETAGTFFIKAGNPSVGSETLQGESWMTQRHEFRVYTQQAGEVLIPPIKVRFEAKADFLAEPEPHSGETRQLRFNSRRPPGTADLKVVVSAAGMEIEQIWPTEEKEFYEPGDVVVRRITRRAKDTTGMVFPAPDLSAPDGVRVYASDPEVHDQTDREEITAERTDVVKYQFSKSGSFALPDLEFFWWNPDEEKLETKTLSGKTFEVKAPATAATSIAARNWKWLLWIFPVLLLVLAFSKVRKFLNRPERQARLIVIKACRANDPKAVYAAVLAWKQRPFSPEFSKVWKKLGEVVYKDSSASWNGEGVKNAFIQEVRNTKCIRVVAEDPLAPLNPTG